MSVIESPASSDANPPVPAPPAKNWLNSPKSKLPGVGLTVGLAIGATLLAPLPGLALMGSLTVALLLGIGWRSIFGLPKTYTAGAQFSAKKLLRYGIILTGIRLNFGLLASSGLQVLLLDGLLIILGLACLPWLGRKLGLPAGLAFLAAVGQSICGASAIGAAATLTPEADEDDVSLAVASCGLVGTLGVLGFIFASYFFNLNGHFYGVLTGSTLQEIAQVVAAGPVGGPEAADLAMIVKLTRVVLLAPVLLILAFIFTRRANRQSGTGQSLSWRQLPLPWFVVGFLLVGLVNSLGWLSKDLAGGVLQVSIFLMVMAMAGMGLQVDLIGIRRKGLRTLAVGTLALSLYVAASLVLSLLFGLA